VRRAVSVLAVGMVLALTLPNPVRAGAAGCVPGPGAELAGCNLANANLYGADLSDADLTGATLTGANLTDANLTGANLTDVQGSSVDLQGAQLFAADLTQVNLTNGFFDGANVDESTMTEGNFSGSDFNGVQSGNVTGGDLTLPTNWSLNGGFLIGPGANLTNADLSGVDLTGVDLASATLSGADLDGASLTGANLAGAVTSGLTGTPATLPANWTVVNGYLIGPLAFLYNADLAGADLSGDDAAGANIEGADLAGANLAGANLSNTNAISVSMVGTNLAGTNLSGAQLARVTSGGITGRPASLPHATPSNWQLDDGYLVGPYVNLQNASLGGANLSSANLHGANVQGANLAKANLHAAYLMAAFLSGATLNGVTSGKITGTPYSLPSGWQLVLGILRPTPTGQAVASSPTTPPPGSTWAPVSPWAPGGPPPTTNVKHTAAKATTATQSRPKKTQSRPKKTSAATSTPQYGIDVYTIDNCASASAWQTNATNEMASIKSLGANSVGITFPFFTPSPTSNTVFTANVCNQTGTLVPLETPSPARLAVVVQAAEAAGLQVLLRPELQEANLFVGWRGTIAPTSTTAWFASYSQMLKPYLEMAQANGVARFSLAVELVSLTNSPLWNTNIAAARAIFKGKLIFDSNWLDPGKVFSGVASGEDAYPDIPNATPSTSVATLLKHWEILLRYLPFPAAKSSVSLDEVGISALDGAYRDSCCYSTPGSTFNQTIQARWFTTACQFLKAEKLAGIYFWGAFLSFNSGNLLTQPDPQNPWAFQPATQTAIRSCFQ
jgi:uncharacterized protein YjbI with pentapeptide repeats